LRLEDLLIPTKKGTDSNKIYLSKSGNLKIDFVSLGKHGSERSCSPVGGNSRILKRISKERQLVGNNSCVTEMLNHKLFGS
jgi:hypothetical protein